MAAGVIAYLDTSAFLKLYIAEPESDAVRALLAGSSTLCTHLITYAEMRAALAKAVRMRRLAPDLLHHLVADLEQDWETLRIVIPDEPMVRRAGILAERYNLRGYDSVHLAAAEAVFGMAGRKNFRIAVYDGQLVRAAASLGMPVFNHA